MKQKIYVVVVCVFFLLSCNHKKDSFEIKGEFITPFEGYIYLSYDEKKDSCLVENGHFSFKGKISNSPTIAYFSINDKISVMENSFYLENNKITLSVSHKEKKINNFDVVFFNVVDIKGTVTSQIQREFEKFESEYEEKENYSAFLYEKLSDIIIKYPTNRYGGDLLSDVSNRDLLKTEELQRLYFDLNRDYQDSLTITNLEHNLFPENYIKLGDSMFHFKLTDSNNNVFETKSLDGKILLIDFWASWCVPCQEEHLELKPIYDQYKNKEFEIVSVSVDKDKDKWINAIDRNKTTWIHLIDNQKKGTFYGEVAKKYGVRFLPKTVLVDSKGQVISIDITSEELSNYLER